MAQQTFELTSKAKILVLYAKTYDMLNERQEQMKGCTVHYLFWGENGEALLGQSEWNINEPVGYQRAKASVDYDVRVKVPIAPAIYEGTFGMEVGSNGKPVQKLKDLAYVCNVEMRERINPGIVVPGMVQPAAVTETAAAAETIADPDASAETAAGSAKGSNASGSRK